MTIFSALRGLIAVAIIAVPALFAGAASAADVTFTIRNSHPNALEVELYSQDRNYVWPGNGEIYYLDDGEAKSIPLSCNEGETICYGAWIAGDQSTFWGTGPNNQQTCDACCTTCTGGETEEINLVP